MNFDKFCTNLSEYHVVLSQEQQEQFASFYELLLGWNQVMNLTAITEWEEVALKHFLDSLSLFRVLKPEELLGKKILDLGTGAGFPGIPLSILLPERKMTLVDSLQKRVRFLNAVIEALSLSDVTAISGRAEDLARDSLFREQQDLVVSRAVAPLSVLSEYCLPFVKIGGFFAAYKSASLDEELQAAEKAISILGGEVVSRETFLLPGSELSRCILLIQKKKASPKEYPRKAGLPKKKPLL